MYFTGEEPEYMDFLEDDKFPSAPIIQTTTTPAPPTKTIVAEDYYYYDDSPPAPKQNAPLTGPLTFEHDYDYEYYDNNESNLKKRALNFKKFLGGMTAPMGTEGKSQNGDIKAEFPN